MKEKKAGDKKKRFSEEKALENIEKKLDTIMNKITNIFCIQKFLDLKIMKDILSSHVVIDGNDKIQFYLKNLFLVLGWISVVTWIVGLFGFLVSLGGLWFMFGLWFGIGIHVLFSILLGFAFSLLWLFTWIGLIRSKKRVISLVVFWFFVSFLVLVLSLIPTGLYAYKSYGNLAGGFFNLITTFVLLLLVVKNQKTFK